MSFGLYTMNKRNLIHSVVATACVSIAAIAEGAIYTIGTPVANQLAFDPIDGSSEYSMSATAENPIYIMPFNGGAPAFYGPRSELHIGTLAGVGNYDDRTGDFSYVNRSDRDGFADLAVLPAGTVIDGSGDFYIMLEGINANYPAATYGSTVHYLGFRYENQGLGGDETYYGWIEFMMPDPWQVFVTRYAIGGDGQPITTGADVASIPESGSVSVLFGFSALIVFFQRRTYLPEKR